MALLALWARLQLEITQEPTMPDAFMATLQLYLDRSAEAPLFLDLYMDEPERHIHLSERNSPALDLLLTHISRWTSFRCIANVIILETPLSLPLLEDLTLGYRGDGGDIYFCFEAAPRLRALGIDLHVSDPKEQCMPGIPQRQITFLKIAQKYREMAALQSFPDLTTLELDVHGFKFQNAPHILLAQLESFTMTLSPWNPNSSVLSLDDLLSMLTFPSLSVLNLHPELYQGQELFWSVNAFDAFILRSSCI
ncbi:hypothetical protein BT96DRAFT_1006159 [Gymnopus androsaceus JB14]|uniref:F-box domain-containing protein n=1 Tax=Gymnopus androsaceus JB14 TaxID=1447944 RepID=A0A6A4GM25_9AGAR|nr:hypothetical protein BT96DRAFT_1006159 [Gymnopus androsaceus JB14]